MSGTLNLVVVQGRLGKDPETRFTSGGQAVANFTIATDESYKNNDGEKIKKTEWHNIVAWGKMVESFIQPYLHKGDLILVQGKLQTRSWEAKDGTTKYTTEIVASNVQGVQSAGDGGAQEAKPAARKATGTGKAQARPAARQQQAEQGDDYAF